MTLPAGLETVTVTATRLRPDGTGMTGSVTFTPSPDVLTAAGDEVLVGGPVRMTFDGSGAEESVVLLATDAAGVLPTGWTYAVVERWGSAPSREYSISLPLATPTVDLSELAPTSPAAGELPAQGAFGISLVAAADAEAARELLGTDAIYAKRALTLDIEAGLRCDGERPVVTVAAATTIASGTTVGVKRVGDVVGADMDGLNDPTFWIGGSSDRAVPMQANLASPTNRVRAWPITGGTGQAARYAPTFRTQITGSHVEFVFITPGATFDFSLAVDGKRSIVSGGFTSVASTTYFVRFDFGTARTRILDLTVTDPDFFGLRYPTGSTAVKPTYGFGPRLWVEGDSMVQGSGVARHRAFPADLGRALGFAEVVNVGVGGTGWTVDGSGTSRIPTRLASNVLPYIEADDTLLVIGSRNDPEASAAAVTAAIVASLATFAAIPNVVVGGPFSDLAVNAAVEAGAIAAGRPFVDLSGFYTGTGNTGAPAYNGNSDRYIGTDGIHATADGHSYAARQLAPLVADAVDIPWLDA